MGRTKITETDEQIKKRKKLAVLVRVLRSSLGLSQRDLSQMTGLSFSAIAKLEYGDIRLHPDKLQDVLNIFDAAGIEFSAEGEAIKIRIGSQVLHKLYQTHGLSWIAEEKA